MSEHEPSRQQRRDRLIHEHVHDPYKTRMKPVDPSVCPQCGAVYESDRWCWGPPPAGAGEQLCQACHRINDQYPAGEVRLSGGFLALHKQELIQLVRNQEGLETAEHPLHRIMSIQDREDEVVVTTTDIHLPRRIGQALHSAYKGSLDVHYDEEGYFIRAHWARA
jgi:hypothetical protein